MATIEVDFKENRLEITTQAFCGDFHDMWKNRKVLGAVRHASSVAFSEGPCLRIKLLRMYLGMKIAAISTTLFVSIRSAMRTFLMICVANVTLMLVLLRR